MNKEASAARRALDIINNLGGSAEEFRKKWLAFHAFCSVFERENQRHSLLDAVKSCIPDQKAEEILNSLTKEMEYLKANPVGNLKLSHADPKFYQNAKQDIEQAFLENRSPSNRLGHLTCVVYQVRCNTEHGKKELGSRRSQRLFRISNKIMDKVIPILVSIGEAA